MAPRHLIIFATTARLSACCWAIAPEPWPPVHGGSFSKPAVPLSPDPYVSYTWDAGVNTTGLQLFNNTPASVWLLPPTNASAFVGWDTLTSPSPRVVVSGPGSLGVDFGVELPAWIEFDSPNLLPADLLKVQVGLGEFNGVFSLRTQKQAIPVHYDGTYRLETNTELYEGVRYAFLFVASAPSAPFTITGLRAVAQMKPVNYSGSFNAPGDALSTRAFYTGAYTVRVNLEPNYMGAVLIDRGDRISWAGDAHVAQAASLAAFGNTWDVAANLNVTSINQNGIASYSLYFTDSVMDFYAFTHDRSLLDSYIPLVSHMLSTAWARFTTNAALTFFGWDDRLGSGFANASCSESQWAYRYRAITEFDRFADLLYATGNTTGAATFHGYATTGRTWAKTALSGTAPAGSPWWSPLGIHAAGEAVNAAAFSSDESLAVLSARFNDTTSLCSLSPFNQAFLLDALAALGAIDRGVASIHLCWGAQFDMGATTFWEVSSPDWAAFTPNGGFVPNGENGFSSLCHPWSSAPTAWLSHHVTGVHWLPPGSSAGRVLIAPHITHAMAAAKGHVAPVMADGEHTDDDLLLGGDVPVGGDSSSLSVQAIRAVHIEVRRGRVSLTLPPGVDGTLVLSELLMSRISHGGLNFNFSGGGRVLGDTTAAEALPCSVSINGGELRALRLEWVDAAHAARDDRIPLAYVAPLLEGGGEEALLPLTTRSRVAVLRLSPGDSITITVASVLPPPRVSPPTSTSVAVSAPAPTAAPLYPPFPPASYRASFLGFDRGTRGNWIGTFGQDGGVLFGAGTGGNTDVSFLPPYIAAVKPGFNFQRGQWPDAVRVADVRAPQDPKNASGPRTAGFVCEPKTKGNPTFIVDVTLAPGATGKPFRVSAYALDWDSRGRRGTFALLDGITLDPVAPMQGVSDEGGVWLSWRFDGPFRVRVSQTRGDNAVLVALLFDPAE